MLTGQPRQGRKAATVTCSHLPWSPWHFSLSRQKDGACIAELEPVIHRVKQPQSLPQSLRQPPKTICIEKTRVERWNGKYPTWFFGSGATPPDFGPQRADDLQSSTSPFNLPGSVWNQPDDSVVTAFT